MSDISLDLEVESPQIVTITDTAAIRIKSVIEKNAQAKDLKLRFWCKSIGGQPKYGMALDNFVNKDDSVIPLKNGVEVLIDKRSLPLLQGAIIDVVKIGLNEQFKIENPNFKLGGCPGCSGGACSGCSA